MSQRAELHFLGAADTVTGSRTLVESEGRRILVDCGLFQGYKVLRSRNWAPFPVPPESIDAVVITHAHLDHTGYLPALVRDGFDGPIYATSGTAELARIMLPDSGYLMEEEARRAARGRWSKHEHPRPLYTVDDAMRSLDRFRPIKFDTDVELGSGIAATFVPAGHILGASSVRLNVDGRVAHFSGDLGRPDDPLMHPPRNFAGASVLVVESTYGDRRHPDANPEAALADVIQRVVKRGGVVLIPAFAVGRTETILLHLSRLRRSGALPHVPIYLNSPMAIDAAATYRRHASEHRITPDEIDRMYSIATAVHEADDSKLLNLRGGPMVIVSASGMLTGGRILHHVAAYGPDPRNAIVLTGFQAGGTRGAALLGGAQSLRIFGEDVPIHAEVVNIDTMSAHADADEILDWMRTAPEPPAQVYVTHGEPAAADTLRLRIIRELGWKARVPEHGERVNL
ncbi:MAG TPA: MBL fold metallo-hydrolase [Candidatus Lumbricidophila sp.]|nr:MBL fold metallo-hydrolase [Candidatus Lumbricidophila sp.]